MIEIIELFMTAPIELQTILLGGIVIGVYQVFKDAKNKDK
jgi:hypothetical protein